jgi:1,4-dihydroxy-2-naphthoate octaprenyltransferase
MSRFVRIFNSLNPGLLLAGILLYSLGVGIASYLGVPVDWWAYLLGQLWVITLQISYLSLSNYFNFDEIQPFLIDEKENEKPDRGRLITRNAYLLIGSTGLTVLASSVVVMIALGYMNLTLASVIVLAIVIAFVYALPPFNLQNSSYRELLLTLLTVIIIPGFSFILQYHEFHRLILMISVPLFANFLALQIVYEVSQYSYLLNHSLSRMITRVGWQNGMLIHDLSVLFIYLSLGIAAWYGLPRFIVIPGYLMLPIGLSQIWQMRRIRNGAKPAWGALKITALAQFGLMVYLFSFAFWTN